MTDLMIAVFTALFVAFVFVNAHAAWLLFRGARRAHFEIMPLNERAGVAVVIGAAVAVDAILGLNRVFGLGIHPTVVIFLLLTSMAITSLPSLIWLYLYYTGKFNEKAG